MECGIKIAVLSDVHGNINALDSVLEDIKKEKADHVIVLGDFITDFPAGTKKTIDTIRSVTDYVIKGNREIIIEKGMEDGYNYNQFITTYLTLMELNDSEKNYIKKLPEQISLIFNENISIRCVHGSPFSAFEHIFENDINKNIDTLSKIPEKILLCGHTHEQWSQTINEKIILNPGSVGINFAGNKAAQYGILCIENNNVSIELKNIDYDFDSFKKSCDLDIPWIKLIISGMEDGKVYTVEFLEEAKKRSSTWPIPDDLWFKLSEEWCRKKGF